VVSSHRTLGEDQQEAEYLAALERSRRTGKPMTLDRRGRPVLPRFPLLTDILTFPFYAGCVQRWIALTLSLVMWAYLGWEGIPSWANWQGDAGGAMRAMAGLGLTMLGAVGGIIWAAAMSSVFVAIVTQSAVGTKRIDEWPVMSFISSMSEMLPVTAAAIFSAAPGWILGKLMAGDAVQLALLSGSSLLLGFPILHLSQLAGGSTWDLLEPKVLLAALRSPISMILIYLESALLAVICVGATYAAAQINETLPFTLAPVYVLCLFYYARLVGRLGWRLSAVIPADEASNDEKPPGTAGAPPLR
jgi:hypothetical protein